MYNILKSKLSCAHHYETVCSMMVLIISQNEANALWYPPIKNTMLVGVPLFQFSPDQDGLQTNKNICR